MPTETRSSSNSNKKNRLPSAAVTSPSARHRSSPTTRSHPHPRSPRPSIDRSIDREEQQDEEEEEFVASPSPPSPTTRYTSTPPSSSASRSHRKYNTTAKGVALHIQKQLLQDIEEGGGFLVGGFSPGPSAFSLIRILKKRVDLYGTAGSELQRQLQNKVHKWKSLSQVEYFQLLADFCVQPARSVEGSAPATKVQEKKPTSTAPTQAPTQVPSPRFSTTIDMSSNTLRHGMFACCCLIVVYHRSFPHHRVIPLSTFPRITTRRAHRCGHCASRTQPWCIHYTIHRREHRRHFAQRVRNCDRRRIAVRLFGEVQVLLGE